MKYYVSWTRRDPEFQLYDSSCNVLVSPAYVPQNWSILKWERLPANLFIDSGAFSYDPDNPPSCADILNQQIRISKGWPHNTGLYFAHPDMLIPRKTSFYDANQLIKLSVERAKTYFELIQNADTPAQPVAVLHGFDEESLLNTYEELKDLGYKKFALGSLAVRITQNKKKCIRALEIVEKYNIKPIHLFGITWPINGVNLTLSIDSFDTSSPAKLAFYGTVLYDSPPKRYVIAPNAEQQYRDSHFSFRDQINEPKPCKCPICIVDPNQLVPKSTKEAKTSRAIHNYFQIKWETSKIN